jgi:hypothetical protein
MLTMFEVFHCLPFWLVYSNSSCLLVEIMFFFIHCANGKYTLLWARLDLAYF